MVTGLEDERSGGYECPHLGWDSLTDCHSVIDEIVSRDDWFWITTEMLSFFQHLREAA